MRLLLLFITIHCCFSCQQNAKKAEHTPEQKETTSAPTQLTIEAEGTMTKGDSILIKKHNATTTYVQTTKENTEIIYTINIPVAGRYIFKLHANALQEGVTAWMEDYIENKDGRTYNITGSIPIPAGEEETSFSIVQKDGSPLNAGKHKMKLHIKRGSALIDKMEFVLLKKHKPSTDIRTQSTDGKEWKIAWADEFDKDGLPDTSKWTFDVGNWGWGNNELQYYTENRLENARVENGNLIIEARKNDMDQLWTSARLTTRGKVAFRFGRIEFRAKVPPNKGNWAAGWTLGNSYIDEISWPYCGEIDILESVGYEMDNTTGNGKAHASAHCGAYYFKLGNQPTGILDIQNMHNEYHIYAVDWTPDGITASVDGKEYFSYNDTSTELSWPFDKPQNLILNLAMGGGWGGLKGMDDSMTSQKMVVDYVRIYGK